MCDVKWIDALTFKSITGSVYRMVPYQDLETVCNHCHFRLLNTDEYCALDLSLSLETVNCWAWTEGEEPEFYYIKVMEK